MDREERLVFVRRLPANRPFTGGFSFRFKKIKIAIDFSRRFAIIILPSALKRGSHGKCAWTGVELKAFRVGPPQTARHYGRFSFAPRRHIALLWRHEKLRFLGFSV